MNAKLSVIVPAYNVEREIGRCLRSILAQQYRELEVIAVDDGSTDNTGILLDRFAAQDARVRVLHRENGGVTSARLCGVREATGKWIGFVDGDDEIEPDMYGRLLSNAERYAAQISHCGYRMVFPDGHTVCFFNTGHLLLHDRSEALRQLLSGEGIEPGLWNKLFRRELFSNLLRSGTVPPDIRVNEDLLMNYRLFSAAERTVYEDFCPYHYILRKNSAATAKSRHRAADPIRVRQIIRDELRGNALYPTAEEAYLRALLRGVAQIDWPDVSQEAAEALRHELSAGALRCCASAKLCLMVLGAACLPPAYRAVRRCRDRVSGVSRRYEL